MPAIGTFYHARRISPPTRRKSTPGKRNGRVCAAEKTRLIHSNERSIEKIEVLDTLLEKAKKLLKLNANMAIQSAWDKFDDLS